jgi:hypothetical protein
VLSSMPDVRHMTEDGFLLYIPLFPLITVIK